MKNKIQVQVVRWSGYELDGKLEDAIIKLQGVIKNNPTLFDFQIEIETESGYYSSCSTNINIIAFRWETDEETETRILANRKRSEAAKIAAKKRELENEKRERTLYENLRKKFEKEIEETTPKTKSND